jgi:ABC-type uncharacterized transport system auxiliary subunit
MRARLTALLVLSAGCALTSRSTPIDVRYFALEADAASSARDETVAAPKLGLGHVTSSAFLRNPIVFRKSTHEVGTYEDWRWTEYPETYLRRSLTRALFETGGFLQGLGTRVPTVDVELVAFEEVLRGNARAGRVQIGYRLHDERAVLAMGVITVERDAGRGAITAVVDAIGAALNEATARLSTVMQAYFAAAPVGRGP